MINTDRFSSDNGESTRHDLCTATYPARILMRCLNAPSLRRAAFALIAALTLLPFALAQSPTADAQRPAGVVKSVHGDAVTITTDAGREVRIVVKDTTRLVQATPGMSPQQLQQAPAAKLSDLQPGDRMVIRGTLAPDGQSVVATTALVMKKAAVAERQERERQDWQQRGVGGLVSVVDPAARTAAISVMSSAGKKNTLIKLRDNTVIRRYQADSVKFDDAQPSTLADLKPGDQLRARGERNADGSEFTAQEIVFGSFRNIAGRITAVDPANGTIVVADLATKKPATVKISSESQVKKLPATLAERLAARLKNTGDSATAAVPPSGGGRQLPGAAGGPPSGAPGGQRAGMGMGTDGGAGGQRGGSPDLQQMLSRAPDIQLSDLQKGEAVMLVATAGSAATSPKAITLLSGVETILTASPNGGGAAMLLSPWNFGGSAPDMP